MSERLTDDEVRLLAQMAEFGERISVQDVASVCYELLDLRAEVARLRGAVEELRTLADAVVDRAIKIRGMANEDTSELERLQRRDEWHLVQLAHTLESEGE